MKSEGSLVTANDTLLTVISQVDPIWVPFNVSENDRLAIDRAVAAGRLALPKDNGYEVTLKLADGTTFPRAGRITFADTRVNPATGSYEMRAELPNRDLALKPGQFVRVQLKGALRRDAIAVPQSAVLDGPQGKFVYVPAKDKDGKDIALPRPITVGPWVEADGVNLWIVETGLAAGDKVIVDGIARLFAPGSPIVLGAGAAGAAGAPGARAGGRPPREGRRRSPRRRPGPDASARPCSRASSSTARSSRRSSRSSSCSPGSPRCACCRSRSTRRSRRRSSPCRRSTPAPRPRSSSRPSPRRSRTRSTACRA